LKIHGIIETAMYVEDLGATEAFYRTILGLTVIAKESGRHVFFQVGEASVLLAFIADATLKGDHLPAHGARGPGHFAMGIDAEALDAWRQKLQQSGIAIEQEVEWLLRSPWRSRATWTAWLSQLSVLRSYRRSSAQGLPEFRWADPS